MVLGLGIIFSAVTSIHTQKKFSDASQVRLKSNLNGYEIANKLLNQANIKDHTIVEHSAYLSDHYNTYSKTLVLSSEVYRGVNVATAGVVAHEIGHVLQYTNHYIPLMLRTKITALANLVVWKSNFSPRHAFYGYFWNW